MPHWPLSTAPGPLQGHVQGHTIPPHSAYASSRASLIKSQGHECFSDCKIRSAMPTAQLGEPFAIREQIRTESMYSSRVANIRPSGTMSSSAQHPCTEQRPVHPNSAGMRRNADGWCLTAEQRTWGHQGLLSNSTCHPHKLRDASTPDGFDPYRTLHARLASCLRKKLHVRQ